eukprot:308859-Hanusia_phi.AAC.3
MAVPRPYAIPVGTWGLVTFFLPCYVLSIYVLFCLSTFTVSICIGVVGSGVLGYYALNEAKVVGDAGNSGGSGAVRVPPLPAGASCAADWRLTGKRGTRTTRQRGAVGGATSDAKEDFWRT